MKGLRWLLPLFCASAIFAMWVWPLKDVFFPPWLHEHEPIDWFKAPWPMMMLTSFSTVALFIGFVNAMLLATGAYDVPPVEQGGQ